MANRCSIVCLIVRWMTFYCCVHEIYKKTNLLFWPKNAICSCQNHHFIFYNLRFCREKNYFNFSIVSSDSPIAKWKKMLNSPKNPVPSPTKCEQEKISSMIIIITDGRKSNSVEFLIEPISSWKRKIECEFDKRN